MIGVRNFDKNTLYMQQHGFDNPISLFAPFVEAGIYHLIFVSIVAICIKFNTKISNLVKNTIYTFPILTIILAWPIMIPTMIFARLIQMPFGNI